MLFIDFIGDKLGGRGLGRGLRLVWDILVILSGSTAVTFVDWSFGVSSIRRV